jgi:hypothetical protein
MIHSAGEASPINPSRLTNERGEDLSSLRIELYGKPELACGASISSTVPYMDNYWKPHSGL